MTEGEADFVSTHVQGSLMSASSPLSEFVGRHVGPREDDVEEMLAAIGRPSLDALCDAAVPGAIRQTQALTIEASVAKSSSNGTRSTSFPSIMGRDSPEQSAARCRC